MIDNGKIEIIEIGGATYDENGDLTGAVETVLAEIPCNAIQKSNRKIAYADGTERVSSYDVLIDMQEFEWKRIRLHSSRGKTLGDFEVLNIEFMEMAQRVKITI